MAVKIDLTHQTITLGVGDLVAESMMSVGRIAGLSVWARMEMGRDVHTQHQRTQAELHQGYAREIFVRHETTVDDFAVTIQGRIDGVIPPVGESATIIEEIKSVVTPPLMFAALSLDSYPHYVEQLRLYCFFIQQQDASRAVIGRLVFINVADQLRRPLDISGPFDDCRDLIVSRVRALLVHARSGQENERKRRERVGHPLSFPHDQPRKHQDEMIAAIERALQQGRHLLVTAPSGIGKLWPALYPTVKHALANNQRVFFVTAKNTQHANALATLRRMGGQTPAVSATSAAVSSAASQQTGCASLELTPDPHKLGSKPRLGAAEPPREIGPTAVAFRAREKMCINSVYACRAEFCPHLQMFGLKLRRTGIVQQLFERGVMTADELIEAGRRASLCPFELALLEAEQTDVIVCDYNYVFDPQVYFRRFFQDTDYSDIILIIDEAHNLVQRALEYYSPILHRSQLRDVLPHLRALELPLAKAFRKTLGRIDDFFRAMTRHQPDEYSQLEESLPDEFSSSTSEREAPQKFTIGSPRQFFEEIKPELNRLAVRYMLDKLTSGRAIPDDPIEEFLSDFGHFYSVLTMEGPEFAYVFDTSHGQAVQIICLDPSRQLQKRLEGFHSVIAMSATLEPMEFYQQMLGFESSRTDRAKFPSPFPKENRSITVVDEVMTTYRRRASNYGKIAQAIQTTINSHRGHYMALFPSYEFLREVGVHLESRRDGPSACPGRAERILEPLPGHAGVPSRLLYDRVVREQRASFTSASDTKILIQSSDMTEQDRADMLSSLLEADPPKLILAVQGGVFSEGVDYPGDLLSGVIVISPALPQVSFEREMMRRYYDQVYGKGFEFAYLYPGMNRVIQSVGRLIRTETDRGVAVLVCQRFRQPQYRGLFPTDWPLVSRARNSAELAATLRTFWQSFECSAIQKK